jgi:hypothetical protein
MNEQNILEKWFREQQGKYVEIIIAGRVFGGRVGESPQRVRAFQWLGDALCVRFETTERLVIVGIKDISIGDYDALIISAEDARFGWHYYGKPQSPENWCEEIYRRQDNIVKFVRLGPLLPGTEIFEYEGEDFVVLL